MEKYSAQNYIKKKKKKKQKTEKKYKTIANLFRLLIKNYYRYCIGRLMGTGRD